MRLAELTFELPPPPKKNRGVARARPDGPPLLAIASSPSFVAGNIAKTSPAAKWLVSRDVPQSEFNSYGARRGNDLIMARGTFANTRISNKLAGTGQTGPVTVHIPSGETMSVFDAAEKYKAEGHSLIILAGKEYGSGSSRDWAAKGPYLQGVKAVIAESFERIHRSNLCGMGIVPMCFKDGQNADSLGLKVRAACPLPIALPCAARDFAMRCHRGPGISAALHCTALHCTRCAALYCPVLHCTVLCCTALHCTALHLLPRCVLPAKYAAQPSPDPLCCWTWAPARRQLTPDLPPAVHSRPLSLPCSAPLPPLPPSPALHYP